MATNLLGVLKQQDEDLRKSLYPISGGEMEHRFTKFIRQRDTQTIKSNINQVEVDNRINFNPQWQSQKSVFNKILQRYHDPSFTAKKRSLSPKQKIFYVWNKLIQIVLLESDQERIFKKDSNWLLLWNFFVLYAYILNIFEIPIAMFFTSAVYHDEYHTFAGLFLNWLAIAILVVNISIVRPNTQFQNLGYLISNRRQIMENYFGRKFYLDLLALIILLVYALSQYDRLIFLKLLFYLDVGTIFVIDSMIIEKIELKTYGFAIYKLIRLMGYMLFILVWLSSIFFYIDYSYYQSQTQTGSYNWLTYSMCAFQVIDGNSYPTDLILTYPEAWYIWLNYAIYWALQTISTVGYGDITPRNPVSVIFTNISILIMMFFFVYFINSVIELIDQMTSSQQRQKKKNIKKFKLYYMKAKQKLAEIAMKYSYTQQAINRNNRALQNTSNNIRSYLFDMDISNLLEEEQNVQNIVNQNLTPQLREELFINYRQMFFKKVLVFGQIAKIPNEFLPFYEKLIYKIREIPYGSDEVIYARGQTRSNKLYYLLKGSVLLQYPNSRYKKLFQFYPIQAPNGEQANNFSQTKFYNFGVRQFFTRQTHDQNAITQSYCKMQLLDYDDFISTIKEFKDFYYKFCELRDIIQIDKINSFTGEQCYECSSRKHHLFNCEKCLFNLRIHIRNQWQNSIRIHVNEVSQTKNQRVPFYYRHQIATQKRIDPKNLILRRSIPQDKVLVNKYYKPQNNILNFDDK